MSQAETKAYTNGSAKWIAIIVTVLLSFIGANIGISKLAFSKCDQMKSQFVTIREYDGFKQDVKWRLQRIEDNQIKMLQRLK